MQHKKTIIIFVLGALAVAMAFGAVAYQSVLPPHPPPLLPTVQPRLEL